MRGKLIERYILGAIMPYFILAAVLLTAILVTQQGAKFAEILGSGGGAPWYWAIEIMLAVLPNVLIFTLPMAMLIGTATGFSRIGSDGELTAMLTAGIGTRRMVFPVLTFAIFLSLLTLYTGFELAPPAARKLRDVSTRAALYRLESPVEPRNFNTDLPGKVIYVRRGDQEEGVWEGVFIQWEEKDVLRLITAKAGHIDTSGEQAELVLNDATITTIPSEFSSDKPSLLHMTSERSEQFRIRDDRINTTRNTILKKMVERPPEFDEMNWQQLWGETSRSNLKVTNRDAVIALHKRLSLCIAPIAFAILGVGFGSRTGRGGRVLGIGISLVVMIIYYLISLVGEQAAHSGLLSPFIGVWISLLLSLCIGIVMVGEWQFFLMDRLYAATQIHWRQPALKKGKAVRNFRLLVLLDWMVIRNLLIYFSYAFTTILSIFVIFTLFELLRYVILNNTNYTLLFRYVLYLLPYVSVTITPLATLISVLVTLVILVRKSELSAWWASGESVYRLLVPVVAFALGVGIIQFVVQENVLPFSNRRQNALRTQIRGGMSQPKALTGKQWLASPEIRRMYSFSYGETEDSVEHLVIYQFDEQDIQLTSILSGEKATWISSTTMKIESPATIELKSGTHPTLIRQPESLTIASDRTQFIKPSLNNPAEIGINDLRDYINSLKSQGDQSKVQMLMTAFERKRSDPFAPLVMAMIGAPLALAFGRRGALMTLFMAVLVGLLFWATTSGMQQLGYNGYLAAQTAAWGPPVTFALVGAIFLSRTRT